MIFAAPVMRLHCVCCRALSQRGGLPVLEHLNLSGCLFVTEVGLQELVSACPSLNDEHFYYCDNINGNTPKWNCWGSFFPLKHIVVHTDDLMRRFGERLSYGKYVRYCVTKMPTDVSSLTASPGPSCHAIPLCTMRLQPEQPM